MATTAPKGDESVVAFKKRLRRTALRTSRATVRKMIKAMRKKAKAIYDADGGDIKSD
jgi:hypothetical protein